MQHNINKTRVTIIFVIILGAFSYNLLYLYKMQVVYKNIYQKKATDVSSRKILIRAPRGEIYDRNYDIPYVNNREFFSILVTPARVGKENYEVLIPKLAKLIGMATEVLEAKLPKSIRSSHKEIEIKESVPFSTIIKVAERINELPGVTWESIPIRNYLFTGSIIHVLGYIGKISQSEFQVLYNEGYTLNDYVGKNGVEKEYDKVLKGKKGLKYKTVDVQGRKLNKKNIKQDIAPVIGKNLKLTIDRNYQTLAEKALGERKGSIIVLKPSTGEILAMVSYPWYDPSEFYIPGKNAFGNLLMNDNKPLLNRAIQAYAPASTFKIIMSTALLEEKAPLDFRVECNGKVFYGDRYFSCWNHGGHGKLNLRGALENSCNIYFFTMGRDVLGIEKINRYARDFGFSQKTGIDIPNEAIGQVPTPEWVKRKYDITWTGGNTMNVSIGQGRTLVTPLQLADMLAFVLNGGVIYKPHVVKEVIDSLSGEVVEKIDREVLLKSSYSPETFTMVKSYLRGVVTRGTARYVFNKNAVKIAGKTGTGQVGLKDRFHDWFISYGPYDAPVEEQIIMVTMIEASNVIGQWKTWATKATNIVYHGIFTNQTFQEVVNDLKPYYLSEYIQ